MNGEKKTRVMRLDNDFWFYADNKKYLEAFQGLIWLAEFPVSEWYDMQHLHSKGSAVFRRRERRLSRTVKETDVSGQGLKLNEYGTSLLDWKGRYLRRCDEFGLHAGPH